MTARAVARGLDRRPIVTSTIETDHRRRRTSLYTGGWVGHKPTLIKIMIIGVDDTHPVRSYLRSSVSSNYNLVGIVIEYGMLIHLVFWATISNEPNRACYVHIIILINSRS
ncbi:hypothetical protein J6590_009475 [Homalodisca vitripennis]|nr:hypothetical protein J6590_009475 [Homalodisca vitripennis]